MSASSCVDQHPARDCAGGFSDLRLFLENKYINETFYEGKFEGRDCIVKCSRKCAWSIGNEFELASRLFAAAPQVVERPLAHGADFAADSGFDAQPGLAYVVTEKIAGPSLAELLAKGIDERQADGFAADIAALAHALRDKEVVHRDLFEDNLLLGADGHLKAIDFQLAVDRGHPREDPWVKRNWKFRYVVFGVNRELGLGVWNDFHALWKILAKFPQTAAVKAAIAEIVSEAPLMTYSDPPDAFTRFRLWMYGVSLRVQMMLRGKKHRKYAQLERRWRTVKCKW